MADVGEVINGYRLRSLLQTGQTSQVFEVVELQSNRHFAMKLLLPEAAEKPEQRRALFNEAEVGVKMTHQNVIRIVKVNRSKETPHYIMEFFPSGSLKARLLRKEHDFIREKGQDLLKQGATALAFMNASGWVHRDVKPDNILITRDGTAKLADLGLAIDLGDPDDVVTRDGATVGTFDYISPEQARDPRDVDVRSDLYSLGCVLFECLAGQPPFIHRNEAVVLQLHLTQPAPDLRAIRPDAPKELAEGVARALAKVPEDRWQTAAAMRESLAGARV